MEFYNLLSKYFQEDTISTSVASKCIEVLAKLMYPITPHICYTLLSEFQTDDALNPKWPVKFTVSDYDKEIQIIIQINGKLRSKLFVKAGLDEKEVIKLAEKDNKVLELIKDKNIIKTIYVSNKLVNFVVK